MSIPDLGQMALWVALVLGAAATAAAALELRGRVTPAWPRRLFVAAAAAVVAGFATLTYLFLTSDLSTATVFFYSRTDLDWPWKLAGVWAGRQGSLLLWATLLAVVAAAVAWLDGRRVGLDAAESRGRGWTRLFLGIALTLFLAAVAGQGTFSATTPALLSGRPLGNGLNPTLRSGFILIHPPLMFLAYSLATVPAAAVLGHLASGTNRWSAIALGPSRLCWLVFTTAIGLGALWAYTTLGFGGYWAWDPVEVANLLPWLALTLYLHAQLRHKAAGSYAAAGPLLGVLPLLLTLFSTVSTRSGLWVSVHAFTDPTDAFQPDGAQRLLDILGVEPSLRFPSALLVALLLVFLAFWCHRLAVESGRLRRIAPAIVAFLAALAAWAALDLPSFLSALFQAAHDLSGGNTGYGLLALTFALFLLGAAPSLVGTQPESRRPRGNAAFAAYSIVALSLALLVLTLFHVEAVNGWSSALYEARFPLLALPVTLGLLVFQAHAQLGQRGLWLAAATALAALAAWQVAGLLWLLLLPALVLVAVSLARTRLALGRGMGGALLLLAALADVLFWANPPSLLGVAWPLQLVFLLASAVALVLAARAAAGGPVAPAALLAGILGGFLVAPLLAAAGFWRLRKQKREAPRTVQLRVTQAGLHAVHLAMALILAGYATSTYARDEVRTTLSDSGVDVGAFHLEMEPTLIVGASGGPVVELRPQFTWLSGTSTGSLTGLLDWEAPLQTHLPRPAIARTWTSDLYLDVEAVHIAGGGPCAPDHPDGYWLRAYQAQVPSRACSGATLDQVQVRAVALPGLALLWGGLVVGIVALAARMGAERRPPAQAAGQAATVEGPGSVVQ
ncbi:MAG: cytochrome c biogenesis protein CcsA [Candidatus Thermoplasmatota archaeon]